MFRLRWLILPLLAVVAAGNAAAWTSAPFIIQFGVGSDRLDRTEMVKLDRLTALMTEHSYMYLILQGHTDRAGSEAYNLALSCRRARSVQDYLLTKGVAAGRMAIESFGEARPITSGPGDLAPPSRRVEVAIADARNFAYSRQTPPC